MSPLPLRALPKTGRNAYTHPESPHATQYWEHIVVEGDHTMVTGERKMHISTALAAVGDFFEWDARACLERGLRAWDVAPPPWCVAGSVLIWEFFVHVDVTWTHDDVVARVGRALDIHEIHCRPCNCIQTASISILKVQLPQRRSINVDNKDKQPQHLS